MKSDNLWRHLVVPLGVALLIYVLFYSWIEHRRTRNGPWQVTFKNTAEGAPAIVINQPKLAITNVEISFPGAVASNSVRGELMFAQAKPVPFEVPFGKCVFMDTTFLPGTLVFDLFGHEIQLIPRTLRIDGKETAWESFEDMTVSGTNVMHIRY